MGAGEGTAVVAAGDGGEVVCGGGEGDAVIIAAGGGDEGPDAGGGEAGVGAAGEGEEAAREVPDPDAVDVASATGGEDGAGEVVDVGDAGEAVGAGLAGEGLGCVVGFGEGKAGAGLDSGCTGGVLTGPMGFAGTAVAACVCGPLNSSPCMDMKSWIIYCLGF